MKDILKELYFSGLSAVEPSKLVKENIKIVFEEIEKAKRKKVVLFSIGKAGYKMAKGAMEELKDYVKNGIVLTKYGHLEKKEVIFPNLKIIEAGHPVPDRNSLKGTKEILKKIEKEKENSIFLIMVSGGTSSLLVYPKEGINLKEKIKTTEILLKKGANIFELNCVRKHLSKVKGGNLLKFIYPAPTISFIISDVIGDKLDTIGSGSTTPDETTFKEAMEILLKYKIEKKVSENVLNLIKKGVEGKIEENPKINDKIFKNVKNVLIGNNSIALKEIQKKAEEKNIFSKIISKDIQGEAKEMGKYLANIAIEEKKNKKIEAPLLLIFGGETTVNVKGKGKGGRAQEVALSFAKEISGLEGIFFLSAGSDGTDGPTEAAGAIVDGNTIREGEKLGLKAKEFLENNDSYNFFKKINSLFITGPTGTNVMDFYLILIK